jgi:hypothetical protein
MKKTNWVPEEHQNLQITFSLIFFKMALPSYLSSLLYSVGAWIVVSHVASSCYRLLVSSPTNRFYRWVSMVSIISGPSHIAICCYGLWFWSISSQKRAKGQETFKFYCLHNMFFHKYLNSVFKPRNLTCFELPFTNTTRGDINVCLKLFLLAENFF